MDNNKSDCESLANENIDVDFLNIDHDKWLSEKPLSILQLDPADRAVLKIADQRDRIQKKTFTKWANKHLNKISININDLFDDLRDGNNLISLLEVLSQKPLRRERGQTRFHSLENVKICLDFLTDSKIRLVNIRSDEIVDGNPKLTLGLIWIVILHFQISDITIRGQSNDFTAKEALKLWVHKHLEDYNGISVNDFAHSWKDGKAFLAILHRHKPDKINLEKSSSCSSKENLQQAFDIAEKEFGVTKLLDPEDVDVIAPDERSILTYVSLLYDAMPNIPIHPSQIQKEKEKRGLLQEYLSLAKHLREWIDESYNYMNMKTFSNEFLQLKSLVADMKTFRLEQYSVNLAKKTKLAQVHAELQNFYHKQVPLDPEDQLGSIEKLWTRLDASMQTREGLLDRAIDKYDKLKKMYDRLLKESQRLDECLNVQELSLDTCQTDSSESSTIVKQIENEISTIQQQFRVAYNEAQYLKDEDFPNTSILIDSLSRVQQRMLDMLVVLKNRVQKARLKSKEATSNQEHRKFKLNSASDLDNSEFKIVSHIFQKNSLTNRIRELLNAVNGQYVIANSLVYRMGIDDLERELEKLKRISDEAKNIGPQLDDLYESRRHVLPSDDDYNQINTDIGELQTSYANLCNRLNCEQLNFDNLLEFSRLFNETIRVLNEIEDNELGRDWSKPDRLNSVDLDKYKNDIDSKLVQVQLNHQRVVAFGEMLVDNKHPASKDIALIICTIQNETIWIGKLVDLLVTHLDNLRNYENFKSRYAPIDQQLHEIEADFKELKMLSEPTKSCDAVTRISEYNQIKQRFDLLCQSSSEHYADLEVLANQISPLRMRSKRLHEPYNMCPIGTDYSTSGVRMSKPTRHLHPKIDICTKDRISMPKPKTLVVRKGAQCLIEDNSNRIKWSVLVEDNQTSVKIPSVCFMLPTPDPDLIASIEKLKERQDCLNDMLTSLYFQLKFDLIQRSFGETDAFHGATRDQKAYEKHMQAINRQIENFKDDLKNSKNEKNLNYLERLNEDYADLNAKFKTAVMSSDNCVVDDSNLTPNKIEMAFIKLEQDFDMIMQKPFVIKHNANKIAPNTELEHQLAEFKNKHLRRFDTDLKETRASIENLLTEQKPNRFNQIKSKYNDMRDVSNLCHDGFETVQCLCNEIDSLSDILCDVEIKLATQVKYDPDCLDTLNKELDSMNKLDAILNEHEDKIGRIKKLAATFKTKLKQIKNDKLTNVDIHAVESIVQQIDGRWSTAFTAFNSRKTALKGMLQAYGEYEAIMKVEKDWLKAVQTRIESEIEDSKNNNASSLDNLNNIYSDLITRKVSTIDGLNDKLADLNQYAKDFRKQVQDIKDYLERQINTQLIENLLSEYDCNLQNDNQEQQANHIALDVLNVINYELNDFNNDYVKQIQKLNQILQNSNDNLSNSAELYDSENSETNPNDGNMNKLNTKSDYHPCDNQIKPVKPSLNQPHAFFYSPSPSPTMSQSATTTTTNATQQSKYPLYTKDKYLNQHNYPSCRVVSTASDYRLTLTDFIDLKLIDNENGLIINPLNGQRLTLVEAIQLEFINSDIKEITNIYDSCNSKLTIKEAINIELINPIKNEICIRNSKIKLNFYEARLKNLIHKPLTLTEAFMLNLIKINGYVRNPINQNFIEFSKVVTSKAYGLFDLDTKHILDPYRNNRLLSITEAIECKLIIADKFQIYLQHLNKSINLYEAYYNFNKITLSLLLYKPEIENIYIRPSSRKQPTAAKQSETGATSIAKATMGTVDQRDKIGLIEAINFGYVNLNHNLYYLKYNEQFITLNKAIELHYVDDELDTILNSNVGIQRNAKFLTIRDCILDSTLVLDKYLFRNPFNNEYLHLDNHVCKSILTENCLKLIKLLITRINIKSYVISFNSGHSGVPSSSSSSSSLAYLNTTQVLSSTPACIANDTSVNIIDLKYNNNNSSHSHVGDAYTSHIILPITKMNDTDRALTIETIRDGRSETCYGLNDAINMGIIDRGSLMYKNLLNGQLMSLNEAYDLGYIDGTYCYYDHQAMITTTKDKMTGNKRQAEPVLAEQVRGGGQHADGACRVDYVIDPDTNLKLCLNDAVCRGIYDPHKRVYINKRTNTVLCLNDALNKGLIELRQQLPIGGINHHARPQPIATDTNKTKNTCNLTRVDVNASHGDREKQPPPSDTLEHNSVQFRQKKIIERHAVSYYNNDVQPYTTLVIDDMRHDNHLNIEGETHVYKNEITIETENNMHEMEDQNQTTLVDIRTVPPTNDAEYEYYEHCIDINSQDKDHPKRESSHSEEDNILSSSSSSSFSASNTVSSSSSSANAAERKSKKQNPLATRNLVLLNEYIDQTSSTVNVVETINTTVENLNQPPNDDNRDELIDVKIKPNTQQVKSNKASSTGSVGLSSSMSSENLQKSSTDATNDLYDHISIVIKESNGGELLNELNLLNEELNDIEYDIAKQGLLSDNYDTLKTETEAFDRFYANINKNDEKFQARLATCGQLLDKSPKLKPAMSNQYRDLINRYALVKCQLENRQKTFYMCLDTLQKFNTEKTKLNKWLQTTDDRADKILNYVNQQHQHETPDFLATCRKYDSECKNLGNFLIAKQSEVNLLKSLFQSFTSQTVEFHKTVHSFNITLKSLQASKRMLNSSPTDSCAHLKQALNDVNCKYQSLNGKLGSARDSLLMIAEVDNSYQFIKSKCVNFVDDAESKVCAEEEEMEHASLPTTAQFESKIELFQILKDHVIAGRSFFSDLNRFKDNSKLFEYRKDIDDLNGRYDGLAERIDRNLQSMRKLLANRVNHQETVRETVNWLANIENVYLDEMQMLSSDQLHVYIDELNDVIGERRAQLTAGHQDNVSDDNDAYQHTLAKLDLVQDNLNKKRDEHVQLARLVDEYRTKCDHLNGYFKQAVTKIDALNPHDRKLDQLLVELNGINKELNLKNADLVHLKSLHASIENASLLNKTDTDQMSNHLIDINMNHEQLTDVFNKKFDELKQLNGLYETFYELKRDHEQYLTDVDNKLKSYGSIDGLTVDLDHMNRTFVEFNELVKTHEQFANVALDKCNHQGRLLLSNQRQQCHIDVEQCIRELNNRHACVNVQLDKCKALLIGHLDLVKTFYQQLNGLSKSIAHLDSKLTKLYKFNEDDNDNDDDEKNAGACRLPVSRNILDYLHGNLMLIKPELDSIGNDIGTLKQNYSNRLPTLDPKTFSDLETRFFDTQSLFTEKTNSLNLFRHNVDSYEEDKAFLVKILDSKTSCLVDIVDNVKQRPQSDDNSVGNQLDRLNSLHDDLLANDNELLRKLNATGDMIMDNCLKRDCDYIRDDLDRLNGRFSGLVEQYNKHIESRVDLKTLLDKYSRLAADLDYMDSMISEYQSRPTQADQTDQILHEIEGVLENKLMPKCIDNLNTLANLVLATDDKLNNDLRQKLIGFKKSLNTTSANIVRLKFNKKFDQLNGYLVERLQSNKFNEAISGHFDRLKVQKYDYDVFHLDIDSHKDDYKQFFTDYHANNNYDILTRLKTIELNWKLLFTKSQEKKDKLMLCFDLAEQSSNYYVELSKWLTDIETRFHKATAADSTTMASQENLIEQLDNDEHFQKELKVKLNCLKNFVHVSNELQMCVQCDKTFVDEKITEIERRFSHIQNENKIHMQVLNDLLQKYMERDDVLTDLANSLQTSEDRLGALNFDLEHNKNYKTLETHYKALYDDTDGHVRSQFTLVADLNRNLFVTDHQKITLDSLNERFTRLIGKIADRLALASERAHDHEQLHKAYAECLNNLINVEVCFDDCTRTQVDLTCDSLSTRIRDLNNIRHAYDLCGNQLTKLHDNQFYKDTCLLSTSNNTDDDRLVEKIKDLTKRSVQLDSNLTSSLAYVDDLSTTITDLTSHIDSTSEQIVTGLACIKDFSGDLTSLLERVQFDRIKTDVVLINSQFKELAKEILSNTTTAQKSPSSHFRVNACSNLIANAVDHSSTSLAGRLDTMNSTFDLFNKAIYAYEKQYELNAVKTDCLRKTVNENLAKANDRLNAINKTKITFTNVYMVDENMHKLVDIEANLLNTLSVHIGELTTTTTSINDNSKPPEMDSFDLTNRKFNLIKRNYDSLGSNLKEIKANYDRLKHFIDTSACASKFNLNCIEPIVIKSQLDRCCELDAHMMHTYTLIDNIREHYTHLLNVEEGLMMDAQDHDIDCFQTALDRDDVDQRLNGIDSAFTERKYLMDKNLTLIRTVYPLCDEYSIAAFNINELLSKYEMGLNNLKQTDGRGLCVGGGGGTMTDEDDTDEKAQCLQELKVNIDKADALIGHIETDIVAKIVDEVNGSEQAHDDFVCDLNKSLAQIKHKHKQLVNNVDQFAKQYETKRERNVAIMGELDDLYEWLDEVELKIINLDSISYMPEIIKQQLNEQACISDDMQMQTVKYKHLVQKYKRLCRTSQIDDTFEVNEKLNKLDAKCESLRMQCSKRSNELEQALVISKNFMDLNGDLRLWFDSFQCEISAYESSSSSSSADHGGNNESKETIERELGFYKHLERRLTEKKFDFDNLNKSGKQLADLCNANMGSTCMMFADAQPTTAVHLSSDSTAAMHIKSIVDNLMQTYDGLKTTVRMRMDNCDSLLWKSSELQEKVDSLTACLNRACERVEYAEQISAHPDRIRAQLDDTLNMLNDLDKRKKALDTLSEHLKQQQTNGACSTGHDTVVLDMAKKLGDLNRLWFEVKTVTDDRHERLTNAFDQSTRFWNSLGEVMAVIANIDERIRQIECDTVPMDPDSIVEQQQLHDDLIQDIQDREAYVDEVKTCGRRLMQSCDKTDQDEIECSLNDLDCAWTQVKQTLKTREIELQDTFSKACEFQQQLIDVLEWINVQQEKFSSLEDDEFIKALSSSSSSSSNANQNTNQYIKQQITLLKELKEQIDPKQVDIQLLNEQFNDLKSTIKINQSYDVVEALQEPLNSANKEWKRLQNSIIERKISLQNTLLSMGQFVDALDVANKWLTSTHVQLDAIGREDLNECRLIDIELARLNMIANEIKAQEQCVDKLKETGKNIIRNETSTEYNMADIKANVQFMIDNWLELLIKMTTKEKYLNDKLAHSQEYQCDVQDMLLWLADIEVQLVGAKPLGGLPDTAHEQLDKFMQLYEQLDAYETRVRHLLDNGQSLVDSKRIDPNSNLHLAIESLNVRWTYVRKKAADRRDKLEQALRDANDFHRLLQAFIGWLTDTEKTLNTLKPVSRQLDKITQQIGDHQQLQKDISEHREHMAVLDKLGTHLKYYSQKQDSILIKNLLISIQNRWERIVSRSAERTRDLERGFKDTKGFYDACNELKCWLDANLDTLDNDEFLISNQPYKIKQQIARHKEFHRVISDKQPIYDATMKMGKRLVDKSCDTDHDRHYLTDMLNEIKAKWQTLCYQSIERQKKLEDALLCTGQFRDALQSLCDWLCNATAYLDAAKPVNGDLQSVQELIDENKRFQNELQHKSEQIVMLHGIGNDLMKSSTEDSTDLDDKLNEMNNKWAHVQDLNRLYNERLERAECLAKQFHQCVKLRIDWLNTIEQQLKLNLTYYDNEVEIVELIEKYEIFLNDLKEQEIHIKQCLVLGADILQSCIPDASININHWLAVIQSKWDEIVQLNEIKLNRLKDVLNTLKENEMLLNELVAWLNNAEAHLNSTELKQLPNSIDIVEDLLFEHQEFQNEMSARQANVERITKSSCVKDADYLFLNQTNPERKKSASLKTLTKANNSAGWKTPEPKMRNPRVKCLFDKWRKVWLMSLERDRKLKEALDRLKELETLKNFNFDEWRKRYINWLKDNRARIMDFFRRQDKDHDGKISREEFIEGILASNFQTTRLELEAVADIFDLDKDGFIDYKEFFATLKPTASNQPILERIRDEVQRQVSLCKCSKRYHVSQISERHYRFGDSQKLRLIRILQSSVMVRVGGGWMALDEFLVKNDPCRAKGRTNFELRDQFLRDQSQIMLQQQQRSPRLNSATPSSSIPRIKSITSGSMTPTASSMDYERQTPRNLLSTSNEALILQNSQQNSHSGSLGASLSDLSSETPSEIIENMQTNNKPEYNTKASSLKNSALFPQSKLPVLRKPK